ncbi:MAG: radical SAM protein [Pseudomonadales bacterium]|nr:radical SAM protein [Pseudomonadales bacterium]
MFDIDGLKQKQLKTLIDVSNKCNLRCRMCHFSYDKVFYRTAIFMSPTQFSEISEQVLPYSHSLVLSAGSEPTTSPHFGEILRIASTFHLKELLFLTNATLLTEKLCQIIIDSGVTQVDISFDGASKKTYEHIRRGASFDKVTKNIAMLSRMKKEQGSLTPRLQFNVTLMRSNLEELPEFVALAEQLGVERIGCRHLMPYADLDMQSESLAHDPGSANEYFQQFLSAADASKSVSVITFPDFFETTQIINITALESPPENSTSDDLLVNHNEMASGIFSPSFLGNLGPTDERPSGDVDSPSTDFESVNRKVTFRGWAIDQYRITNIHVFIRVKEEGQSEYLLKVGDAKKLNGSRPDVSTNYPDYPNKNSAGWEFYFDIVGSQLASKETLTFAFMAENLCGFKTFLGEKVVSFYNEEATDPYLFCKRPFTSVYIDTNGDVYPYPDCRPDKPYGNLLEQKLPFEEVWNNTAFRKLRREIAQNQPPKMCVNCPDFINRNVDDDDFFENRDVEDRYKTEFRERKRSR